MANKLTAQSIALGIVMEEVRPARAKAFVLGLLPLQGVESPIEPIPQGVALGYWLVAPSGRKPTSNFTLSSSS